MKETKLSKFDWVEFEYPIDGAVVTVQAQIIEIGENKIVKCQRGDEIYTVNSDDLFPIVVLDDNLIGNGFKHRQVTNELRDFFIEKRTKVVDGEAESEEVAIVSIRMRGYDTEPFDITVEKHLEWHPSQRKKILYFERWGMLFVNELQHYLREVGLDDLADNFKMED